MRSYAFPWRLSLLSLSIWFSTDALARPDALDNWGPSKVATNDLGYMGDQLEGVAYGNGRFVAVGQQSASDFGVVQISNDGVIWTKHPVDPSILDLYDVTWFNGIFVAVGWDAYGGNNVYHSTNGIDWVAHSTVIGNVFRVTHGGTVFVAVGDGLLLNGSTYTNRNIYSSPDGITWTARNSSSPANDVHGIEDVAYGAGRFVAVDDANHIYTSVSGTTWSRMTNANAGARVSFCNDLFILSTGAGSNLLSSDGLNWTLVTNTTAATFGRVIFLKGNYLALTAFTAFSSTNGTNWVQRNLQTPANVLLQALVVGVSNVVAVGYTYGTLTRLPIGYLSDPFVGVTVAAGYPPQVLLSGLLGRTYRIDYLTDLRSNNWRPAATFALTNSPTDWTDIQATNSSRYYRAVLLP